MKLVTLQVEVEIEYNTPHTIHQLVEKIQDEIRNNSACIHPISSKNIVKIESIASKQAT